MDSNGFLEGELHCKLCGSKLHGEGSGYPAETYASTFTGLCYPCTNKPKILTAIEELDGAHLFSFAPHCPSWRRDRETYIAYLDCKECDGEGRLWVSRAGAFGGSYTKQCESCSKRYYGHPWRRGYQDRYMKGYRICNEAWKDFTWGWNPNADKEASREVAAAFMWRYEQFSAKLSARQERLIQKKILCGALI